MTVVEKLKHLSDQLSEGVLERDEFERKREALLESVEPAVEAPPRAAPHRTEDAETAIEPGVTLVLVALASIVPPLIAMLLFNLPLWTGGTIFVAFLGALTFLWARTLRDPEDG